MVYYRDFLFLKIVYCISIIMLQKVAAIVNKVAADLCVMASKVRLLLHKKFFEFAATSAACLLLDDNDLLLEKQHQQLARQSTLCRAQGISLYIIVVLNLRRYSVFAPKIGDFERKIGANDMRKLLYYNNFRISVFFLKKSL